MTLQELLALIKNVSNTPLIDANRPLISPSPTTPLPPPGARVGGLDMPINPTASIGAAPPPIAPADGLNIPINPTAHIGGIAPMAPTSGTSALEQILLNRANPNAPTASGLDLLNPDKDAGPSSLVPPPRPQAFSRTEGAISTLPPSVQGMAIKGHGIEEEPPGMVPVDQQVTFDLGEVFSPAKLPKLPASPFNQMSEDLLLKDVNPNPRSDPNSVEGDGITEAIRMAMEGRKPKPKVNPAAPTGAFAGNDQTSMFPAEEESEIPPADSDRTMSKAPLESSTRGVGTGFLAPAHAGGRQFRSPRANLVQALFSRLR